MKTEYEVRILNVDKNVMMEKLEKLGAIFQGNYLQQRYVYDFHPAVKGKWIRLRTNGKKTTLTIKNIMNKNIDGTKELEIEVNDFENTNLILNELGYNHRSFQENRRCQYILNGVEIDIDSWPLLPDYVEIEGKNEKEVYEMVEKLGYTKKESITTDVDEIYKEYGFILDDIKDLKLEENR